jgi:nucleotide-binding universal stress UspA family protein
MLVIDDGSAEDAAALEWAHCLALDIHSGVTRARGRSGREAPSPLRQGPSSWPCPRLGGGRDHDHVAGSVAVAVVAPDQAPKAFTDTPTDLVVASFAHALRVADLLGRPGRVPARIRCPIAIVPVSARGRSLPHFVVGVSGSEPSLRATRWCDALAHVLSTHVHAVYATGSLIEWVSETSPSSWRHIAQRQLNTWIAPMIDAVETRLVEDIRPVAALGGVSQQLHARLLVVGAQRSGRVGNTPLRLASETHTPVVVVP